LGKAEKGNTWRDFAIAAYKAPADSKIYGTFEIDITETMRYIQKRKAEGKRLTVTNFVAAALSRALYEDIPDINCFVRRGKVVYRQDANVCISVSVKEGKEMTGLVIPKTQELSVSEIADYAAERIEKKRKGEDAGAFAAKDVVAKIPWPFRRPVFLFIKWWIFDLGFSFPFLKIPHDPFGSIMLTNIGTWGLTTGMPALFPIGKLPAVLSIGKIEKKPVVVDGQIVIRSILPISGTFDHRIVDGAQGGKLAHGIVERLKNPEGVLAIAKMPSGRSNPDVQSTYPALYLWQINDPGNLGAIMRTTLWFGIGTILISPGSVDVYSPKVVRSAMGALFRLTLVTDISFDRIEKLMERDGAKLWAADMSGVTAKPAITGDRIILAFGSESHGLPQEVLRRSAGVIGIKKYGYGESLNLAVSVGVILNTIRQN